MRPFASIIVRLLCVFASKVSTEALRDTLHIVDYRTLKTCYSRSDCLPWQVCASCVHSSASIFAKYCSDFTYRGICGYNDEEFSCSCDEDSCDKPQDQRVQVQKLFNQATSQGPCVFDNDCDDPSRENNFRCSTCMQPGSAVFNVCGDPEHTAILCNPSGLCSCGQLYPEPQRIWPLTEQKRFIDEQKKLGGLNVGDAGSYLAQVQPVAATPEIDFTGFNDQTADSSPAGKIPGDVDWTV